MLRRYIQAILEKLMKYNGPMSIVFCKTRGALQLYFGHFHLSLISFAENVRKNRKICIENVFFAIFRDTDKK